MLDKKFVETRQRHIPDVTSQKPNVTTNAHWAINYWIHLSRMFDMKEAAKQFCSIHLSVRATQWQEGWQSKTKKWHSSWQRGDEMFIFRQHGGDRVTQIWREFRWVSAKGFPELFSGETCQHKKNGGKSKKRGSIFHKFRPIWSPWIWAGWPDAFFDKVAQM
jgi:hypothetical protein